MHPDYGPPAAPGPPGDGLTRTLGRHTEMSWAAAGAVAKWGSAQHRHRLATRSFGERAVKGCLWWVLFGWFFVLWRMTPYFLAAIAVMFVGAYAVMVSLVWLLALAAGGVVAVVGSVSRRRKHSLGA